MISVSTLSCNSALSSHTLTTNHNHLHSSILAIQSINTYYSLIGAVYVFRLCALFSPRISSPSLYRYVGRCGSGGKSSHLAVGGLPVWSHPGRVEVSLSKTPNPQLLLMSWLVPCMAANRCRCVNGWMRGINCTAPWINLPFYYLHVFPISHNCLAPPHFPESPHRAFIPQCIYRPHCALVPCEFFLLYTYFLLAWYLFPVSLHYIIVI